MKNKVNILLVVLAIVSSPTISSAQQINWRSFNSDQKHIATINVGWEYGLVTGVGYGYKFKTKLPLVVNAEYSFPFGRTIFDDFKTKIGGQAEVIKIQHFSLTLKIYSLFTRYQNELVRMVDFGSEFSGNIGYYRSKWYVAGEFGFDKAIATNVKHSDAMKTIYANIQNGWYTGTGGNYFYDMIAGFPFKNNNDLYIKVGKIVTQDFKTTPTVPYYLQLGYNKRF